MSGGAGRPSSRVVRGEDSSRTASVATVRARAAADASRAPEPSPVERRLARSFIDQQGIGKPLSRRTLQTPRTVEGYLKAGVLPRHMQRLREIHTGIESERRRLRRAYDALREA